MCRLTQKEVVNLTSYNDGKTITKDNYIKNINVVHDYLCDNDFNFTDNLMLLIREKKKIIYCKK